jgi:hypothetical protein
MCGETVYRNQRGRRPLVLYYLKFLNTEGTGGHRVEHMRTFACQWAGASLPNVGFIAMYLVLVSWWILPSASKVKS